MINQKKSLPSFSEKISFRLRIFYEKLIGVDFTKVLAVDDLGLDTKNVFKCSPTTIKYIIKVLDYLKINKDTKILDIGCGKGYAIKFFKSLGYKTVDGLEISKKLTMIARNNFRKINIHSKIFNINAINLKFYARYDVFYLYNPFPKNIAKQVFFNIKKQIKMSNKKFCIIYANPVAHKILIKNYFICKKSFPYIGNNKVSVYFKN